jgi:glycerophosphoryl diester phosphodiesterase
LQEETTLHLLDHLERPVIFAHRGASVSAPENTMSAFELAVKLGAKAIELDAMLSRDGIPVVIHDHTLERTTNGHGLVGDHDFSDLSCLDAGSWFSEVYKREEISSLHHVLKRFTNKILINIELKNYHAPHDDLSETVIQLIDESNLWDSVLFSSFLPGNLRLIRKRNPSAKVALLCATGIKGWIFRSPFYRHLSSEIIHPAIEDVDQVYIQCEHRNGRRVHVWTVNDKEKAKELFLSDVDGIFTDDPESMLEALRINRLPSKEIYVYH